ncbi:MAG: D-alanyl-D-alanine carboxypeptidase family protein [Pyrinomonadaceae bacterium]|nr:D-alanyl-D-alanine carboxypeptidase family protein [Pyrinomonadaceae bacterium]
MKVQLITVFWFVVVGFVSLAQTQPTYSQEISANFTEVVENKLKNTFNTDLNKICPVETDVSAKRIFAEYGAIFVSSGTKLPGKCIFSSDAEIISFQSKSLPQSATVGGVSITLQKPAMEKLLEAVREAAKKNLRITPRGGSLAAGRSFQDTVNLWNSRFYPALNYWVGRRKISSPEAAAVKTLPIREQVARVLEWESRGIYFSKDLSKSILFSVAAPGASQHNFLLALDVEQFANPKVREILARHGWFQTVKSDLPHFTFLGVTSDKLRELGLKPVPVGNQEFWIPNIVEPTKKLEVKSK